MTERAVKVELFDQFARVAQAAASGRRVEIVDVLANGERSVEELSRQVAMSVANTSRHLQVLKEAGLVAATRDGTRVRYRLASPAVYRFWVALRSLAAERLPGVQGLVEAYLGSREGLEAISGDELLANRWSWSMSDPPRSIKQRMLPERFQSRLRSWSRGCGSYHASGRSWLTAVVRTALLRRRRSAHSVTTVTPPDTSATGCRSGPTPGTVSSRTESGQIT